MFAEQGVSRPEPVGSEGRGKCEKWLDTETQVRLGRPDTKPLSNQGPYLPSQGRTGHPGSPGETLTNECCWASYSHTPSLTIIRTNNQSKTYLSSHSEGYIS